MSLQERTRGRRDAIGVGVAWLNRLAKSRAIDRFGLRKQTERVVFEATRTGFRTAGALTSSFPAASKLAKPWDRCVCPVDDPKTVRGSS